jgi:hypothetical protein
MTPTSPTTPRTPLSSHKPSLTQTQSVSSSSIIIPQTTPIQPQNQIKQLQKDLSEKLNVNTDEFISETFDVKQFTSAIIKTNALSEHLSNLSQSINKLDKQIRDEVSLNHEDLLHQAINIETLEDMLEMIQSRIASLKSTSERLRTKISVPFNELNLRILQLSRLQAACDTLRRIKGILNQSAKLKIYMNQQQTTSTSTTAVVSNKDLVKSAQCLNELEFLLKNFDYTGIECIEQDVHFAFKSRHEVEEQAQTILEKSMIHQDQSQIGTCLQVFYSLGILNQKLVDTLKLNERNFQKLSTDLLNTTNLTLATTNSGSSSNSTFHTSVSMSSFPGRTNMPNIGSMGQFRAQLWTNIEKLIDGLHDSCAQVYQLQQILEKKKDLVSNLLYIDELDFSKIYSGKMHLLTVNPKTDEANSNLNLSSTTVTSYDSICTIIDLNELNSKKSCELLYDHWRKLSAILCAQLQSASTQSNYIKQTFQNEYPKLLKLQNELWSRLTQLNPLIDRFRYPNNSNDKQATIANTSFSSAYELIRKCFTDYENSYLNRSLSHLFDPINLIFSQSVDKMINRADIETYLKGKNPIELKKP